ncbi:MAG: UDP-3-O-(3-hydroxymyristoyl)glucosamine N-acyltransferase [Acidobacteria bacterium]|nr:MAG: UDP-3-O-(3-hydroxymyristoyl)glucosamine N-acyltransferase [Acidobacteriota bacterium]
MPSFTLDEIARRLGGELLGDGSVRVSRVAEVEEAAEGSVAVVIDRRFEKRIGSLGAGAVVVGPGVEPQGKPAIRVAHPKRALVALLGLLHPEPVRPAGVSPSASVSKDAVLGADVAVGDHAVVEAGAVLGDRCQLWPGVFVGEGVVVGEDSVLFPNVVLYPGTRIGKRARIHAGAVVGSDGFGYERDERGVQVKVPQVGNVEVGDDVEIGAGSAIDRATIGTTRIGSGTKIDNLVQVGHNCQVGEHCCLIGQSGLSGSVTLGRFVVLAGQAGISDHVTLADGVVVGAQSGVPHDLSPGVWLGTPPLPREQAGRALLAIRHLPEMRRELRRLSERCRQLEEELARLAGGAKGEG